MNTTDLPPVAGLRGIERIGLTVPDMAQALEFFAAVLGAETLYESGPVFADDNWMAVNLGVAADAVIARTAVVRAGPYGPALELFEYAHPEQERHPPPQSAVGGQHIAFHIEDIDAGVETLRAHGVIALGEPKHVTEGPSRGRAWVRFLAPWGQQLELVSYPTEVVAHAAREPSAWTPGSSIHPTDDAPENADADPDGLRDTDGELDAEPA